MSVINPFDFQRIFVSILSGSPDIFTFLFVVIISGLGAYFKFDSRIMMIMYVVFGIVMMTYIGAIYVLIILVAGIVTFYSISKMFNR